MNISIQETVQLNIQAADMYSANAIEVKELEQYQFTCDKNQKWKDWYISTSPDGYFNLGAWLIGLRVKHAKCFCLSGVYNQDDKTAFAIGSNNIITMEKPGVVSFFANDAKNFYKNNTGSVMLNIKRLK